MIIHQVHHLGNITSHVLDPPGQVVDSDRAAAIGSNTTTGKSGSKQLLRQNSTKSVSDSEEERLISRVRMHSNERCSEKPRAEMEVIEISSDEEEVDLQTNTLEDDSFMRNIPGGWSTKARRADIPRKDIFPSTPKKFSKRTGMPSSRRIVLSSESETSDNDTRTDLHETDVKKVGSDSSPQRLPPTKKATSKVLGRAKEELGTLVSEQEAPLYAEDDSPWDIDDGSILILNEPSSARKPIRNTTHASDTPVAPSVSRAGKECHASNQASDDEPLPLRSPSPVYPSTPSRKSPTKAPRTTKKVQTAVEQARREAYAQEFFDELNRVVFRNGLPKETKLNWNNRLLTTAGRARWHRSRDGMQTTEIELAIKILDCDERIRNTLSHEMCHLACWLINGEPREGHGRIFKSWAAKVMRCRPDIEVTTKHSYEISYKYEWKCEQCAKIYGRFSKSIDPEKCVCGACKTGRLVPLFTAPIRTPRTIVKSRMAAGTSQGSPRTIQESPTPSGLPSHPPVYTLEDDADSDNDIEVLTTRIGSINIIAEQEGH